MGLCESKKKEKSSNQKLHIQIKINKEKNNGLYNFQNSSYKKKKKINYLIKKN